MAATLRATSLGCGSRPSRLSVRAAAKGDAKTAKAAGTPRKKLTISTGSYTLQGSTRKRNEDRFQIAVADGDGSTFTTGEPWAFCGVYDGHGGYAVSQWLSENLTEYIERYWEPKFPELSMRTSYIKADAKLLAPKPGIFGAVGERGVGGSKCGATASTAIIYKDTKGAQQLLTANIGDARIVLARKGEPLQLTVDHTPDSATEMKRIESKNPNPKMPLVRYEGGTWRVGGLLALSRAFGDAYLKGSLQFEGIVEGGDGYSSGFGLIAEPYTVLTELTTDDTWLIVSSDGLYNEVERGGGGGLTNQQAIDMCAELDKKGMPLDDIAKAMVEQSLKQGSTDDITCCLLKLK
mmetsp:Transcript_8575/g.24626  ORF Transcript_8575/g.24626 Transcript_8575/m.24626 type:complete len:350 (+) Transcript_8575:295-1344(+)